MSYRVDGKNIYMTRGNYVPIHVHIEKVIDPDTGEIEPYNPTVEDKVIFAVKQKYTDPDPLIWIEIPYDTLLLEILPEHTDHLKMGKEYVYDITLHRPGNKPTTFITEARLVIEPAVGWREQS